LAREPRDARGKGRGRPAKCPIFVIAHKRAFMRHSGPRGEGASLALPAGTAARDLHPGPRPGAMGLPRGNGDTPVVPSLPPAASPGSQRPLRRRPARPLAGKTGRCQTGEDSRSRKPKWHGLRNSATARAAGAEQHASPRRLGDASVSRRSRFRGARR